MAQVKKKIIEVVDHFETALGKDEKYLAGFGEGTEWAEKQLKIHYDKKFAGMKGSYQRGVKAAKLELEGKVLEAEKTVDDALNRLANYAAKQQYRVRKAFVGGLVAGVVVEAAIWLLAKR